MRARLVTPWLSLPLFLNLAPVPGALSGWGSR